MTRLILFSIALLGFALAVYTWPTTQVVDPQEVWAVPITNLGKSVDAPPLKLPGGITTGINAKGTRYTTSPEGGTIYIQK
jgi:hypothetical protein